MLLHKYWIDEIYDRIFVLPVLFLSRFVLWAAVDRGLIGGGGQLAAGSVRGLGVLVQRVQSGNIRSYAGWLTIGAAALLAAHIFRFCHALVGLPSRQACHEMLNARAYAPSC